MSRRVRAELGSLLALIALALVGTTVGLFIALHQRLNPPSWMPVIGTHEFTLNVRLTGAQGVLPGQGQMVTVSGVKVGRIASVDLKDGQAVARLAIERRYDEIYPDATVLLRPKTGLKDMVAELDPGSPKSGAPLGSGATLSTAQTAPDVNFDEFLASLDGETRSYLQLLITDAGRALGGGGGRDLAQVFRRFDPLSRDVAKASHLVARRQARLRRVMSNLSLLASELGRRDNQLAGFVSSSEAVFRRLARQSANLQASISELPPTLESSNRALTKVTHLGNSLRTTLGELEPTARTLAPTLRDLQPFFDKTTPVIRRSLRPFAREAQPTARELVPAAHDLAQATPDLTSLTKVLNAIVDELAYDPPGKRNGYLFYVPWANHNTNSTLSTQDGIAPLRRGLIFVSCGSLTLLDNLILPPRGKTEPRNPTLATLIQLLSAPAHEPLIDAGKCPKPELASAAAKMGAMP